MKNFISILLAAFTFIQSVHATPSNEDPICCTESCLQTCLTPGFEFDVTYLYLKPTADDIDFVSLTTPGPINSPDWNVKSVKPRFISAFDMGVGYVFPNCGNDLKVNWLHFQANNSNSFSVSGTDFAAPFFSVGPQGGFFQNARGKIHHKFDGVNLNAGQYVDIGRSVRLRLYGGVSFAKIKQEITSRFTDSQDTIDLKVRQHSDFMGVGPQLGVSTDYIICPNFSLVGDASGALLIGRKERHMNFTSNSVLAAAAGLASPNFQRIKEDSFTDTIYGLDGKLGLNYTFCICDRVPISIEAGYRVALYINAIHVVIPTSMVVTPATGTVAVSTLGTTRGDFGFNGPYFTVNVSF